MRTTGMIAAATGCTPEMVERLPDDVVQRLAIVAEQWRKAAET